MGDPYRTPERRVLATMYRDLLTAPAPYAHVPGIGPTLAGMVRSVLVAAPEVVRVDHLEPLDRLQQEVVLRLHWRPADPSREFRLSPEQELAAEDAAAQYLPAGARFRLVWEEYR